MVSKSPSSSKPLPDFGPDGPGFQDKANKDIRNEEPSSKSQCTAFTPSLEEMIGNSVLEALPRKEVLPQGPYLSNIKVWWADSLWSISHTALDLWFI